MEGRKDSDRFFLCEEFFLRENIRVSLHSRSSRVCTLVFSASLMSLALKLRYRTINLSINYHFYRMEMTVSRLLE